MTGAGQRGEGPEGARGGGSNSFSGCGAHAARRHQQGLGNAAGLHQAAPCMCVSPAPCQERMTDRA